MPVARFQLPDGRIGRFEVPEGTSPEQAQAMIAQSINLPQQAPPQSQTKGRSDGAVIDSANALGTGGIRGYARLLGLPVDTVMNAIDLGKAGIGSAYMAATGKSVPEWLEPSNRANIWGSGENIIDTARKVPGGSFLVDPSNPEYEGGYLQNAGGALAGVVNPNSRAQLVNQLLTSQAGAAAGKAVYDSTGNAALASLAGMSPTSLQAAGTAGVKRAVRGGEEGRQRMAQRVQDLRNAGIENPTLGLATGNQLIGGIENLLQSTPGAVGIMARSRDAALQGLEDTAQRAAALSGTRRGAMDSGALIQKGGKQFKEDFKSQQTKLYDRLDEFIDPQFPTDVKNTRGTLAALNEDIPGAPALSKQFRNARIASIEDAITSDTAGSPQSVQVYSRPPVGGGGLMNAPVEQPPLLVNIPAGPPRNTLPFEAVKKTRTLVGNEIADNSLLSDVPRSKWNPLYASLSDDMQGAAAAAGPRAEGALNRATDYTRAGLARMERIAPIIDRKAPEESFQALERTLKENTSTFQAVKKSLPEDARGSFAGTIIERLGKATPGQQDATGGKWSPETFLTNWNRISPSGQRELLSGIPNAGEVKALVDSVAGATSMMRDNSRMWANPSGTSANAAARGVIGAIGAGGAGAAAGLLNPMVPIGAGLGVGGVNLTARALTSANVRNAMLRQGLLDPELLNSTLLPLTTTGLLQESGNKQNRP